MRVPKGWVRMNGVSEVWIGPNGSVAVIGKPPSDYGDTPEDEQHNCDAMGCGQDHVILRAKEARR